ncbi:MAG TPA: hypothetical protein PK957_05265 [Candidatus Dojkabacteria bacterium]|nr:hypothetical protein [Candidatus Dojkabacteria bacterium]HQF37017.1 hypothetical protein [Candidatus Dojkabacteria bacterium]
MLSSRLQIVERTKLIDEPRRAKLIGIGNYLLCRFGAQEEFEGMFSSSVVNPEILLVMPVRLKAMRYDIKYDYGKSYRQAQSLGEQMPEYIIKHLLLMITECVIGIDNEITGHSLEDISSYITEGISPEQWDTFWADFKNCYLSFANPLRPKHYITVHLPERVFPLQTRSANDLDSAIDKILGANPEIKPTPRIRASLRNCLLARGQARTYGGQPNYEQFTKLLMREGLTREEALKLLGLTA